MRLYPALARMRRPRSYHSLTGDGDRDTVARPAASLAWSRSRDGHSRPRPCWRSDGRWHRRRAARACSSDSEAENAAGATPRPRPATIGRLALLTPAIGLAQLIAGILGWFGIEARAPATSLRRCRRRAERDYAPATARRRPGPR